MKIFDWNADKSMILKSQRGVSFEDIIFYINQGKILAIIEHHNKDKYFDQKMYVIEIDNYAYLVPFIEEDDRIFLKTIIPSRKATKVYLEKKYEK
jgi:uncharacterized DUF497 family protein